MFRQMASVSKPNSMFSSVSIRQAILFTWCFALLILLSIKFLSTMNSDPTAVFTTPFKINDEINITDLIQAFPNATIKIRDVNSIKTVGRCLTEKAKGRRILINFAKNCCQHSQPKSCQSALDIGGFDVCIMFNDKSLDDEFNAQNQKILADQTGGGYWLWKPYIIMKTLYAMRDGDVLFYTDSGTHAIENVDQGPICLQQILDLDIVVFSDAHLEHRLTKPDTFILMNVDPKDPKFADTNQLISAYFLARKSFRSLRFVGEWLTYAQDIRIISNDESHFGKNPPDFRGHRNDQSIVSLLAKKWGLEIWPDPSQWGEGNPNRNNERYQNLIAKTFFSHTRDKS